MEELCKDCKAKEICQYRLDILATKTAVERMLKGDPSLNEKILREVAQVLDLAHYKSAMERGCPVVINSQNSTGS